MPNKPLSTKNNLDIAGQSSSALLKHLFNYSVSVVDTCNPDGDPKNWKIFSGTLVEIEDKLLVATASHCIAGEQLQGRYWLVGNKAKLRGKDSCVLTTYRSIGDDPDVGIMELDRNLFSHFSDQAGISISRLKPSGIGRCDTLAILIGCPGERVAKEERGALMGLGINTDSYASNPLNIEEWPITERSNLNPDKDIILSYPNEENSTRCLETGRPIMLPDPYGMSGGGLWDQGFGPGLWSAENSFLFGIQSSWFSKERFLRVTQIQHWLKLVYEKYPDLRPKLLNEFPDLFGGAGT